MEKRRLSAIMFTDIVGYTRKMGEDEIRMLRLLRDHNKIVEDTAHDYNGEVVKRVGDAFLISFESAQNAVLSAINIQQFLTDYNQDKLESDQVHIRIGIHLGDVVISEGDVFGDGVNVASRIEPLAHPDGICITRSVYDLVRKQMTVKAVELGPQQLKNVDEAVEVFHLLSGTIGVSEIRKIQKERRIHPLRGLVYTSIGLTSIAIIVILLIVIRLGWIGPTKNNNELASLPTPVTSSNRMAVLPLKNLTGNEENDYYSEGIAEELVFRLSRLNNLYVYPLTEVLSIGENFRSPSGVKQVLGVKYVIQGNLRIQVDSLVIVLEIFDTETLERLSSNRYSILIDHWNNIHNQLAKDILYAVVGRISSEAEAVLAAFGSRNSMANDLYLLACQQERNAVSWSDQQRIMELYESTIDKDSSFALARANLSTAYAKVYGLWQNDTSWIRKAKYQADAAVSLAPDMPEAHYALGKVYEKQLEFDKAERSFRTALNLRPNYIDPLKAIAGLLSLIGRDQEALMLYEQSLAISQSVGDKRGEAAFLISIGNIVSEKGDYETGITNYNKSLEIYHSIGDIRGESACLNNIGAIQFEKGEYQAALDNWDESLKIYRSIGDRLGESTCLINMGITYLNQSELERALEFIEKSLSIRKEIGNKIGESASLNCLGAINTQLNNLPSALEYYDLSLLLCREMGDKRGESSTLNNIGIIHFQQGDYENAVYKFEKSSELKNEIGDRKGEANTLNNIGNIHFFRGNYAEAIDIYEKSALINHSIGSRKEEANALANSGNAYARLFEHKIALQQFMSAYSIMTDLELESDIEQILTFIGIQYYALGMVQAAEDTLKSVFSKSPLTINKYPLANLYLGACEITKGDVETGLIRMHSSLDSLQSLKLNTESVEAYRVLYEVLLELGQTEKFKKYANDGFNLAMELSLKHEIAYFDSVLRAVEAH